MPTVHLLIQGKVQGVFYRATAKDKAIQIGVKGWIKNTSQGDVEAMVSGEEAQLESFIAWCRVGPEGSRVTHVTLEPAPEATFEGFRIVR